MSDLTNFYSQVQAGGHLRTPIHARRWTRAVLQTLGLNLSGGVKKTLTKALPEELAKYLNEVWWLFNWRNTNYSALEFQDRSGRRAGNTDKQFARHPVIAVFGAVQTQINSDVAKKVYDDLSPELKELWDQSTKM